MATDNLKVLAIDDNQDNLTSLKAVLKDALPGATAFTALNGPKGIELAATENPDVILLDIVMPGMDGFEVCRTLKADERVRHVPVVFLTALKTDRESRIKALEAGADGFLSKPVDEEVLTAQLQAMAKVKIANEFVRQENEQLAAMVAECTLALQEELAQRRKVEEALLKTNKELESSRVATLNLLEDLKQENQARKNSEQALRESEELYRSVFDNAAIGIDILDSKGKFLQVNGALVRILGYSEEELRNLTMLDITHPEDIADSESRHQKMVKGEADSYRLEKRYVRKNGEIFWADVSACPVRGADGVHEATVGVIADITERKKAEEALRQEQIFTDALLENMVDGVVACDADFKLALFNRTAREWHGLDPMAVPAEKWAEYYDLYCADGITPMTVATVPLARAFRGEVLHNEGMVIRAKGKPARHILANCAPFFDKEGTKLGAVGVMHDITEGKKTEEALRQSEDKFKHVFQSANVGKSVTLLTGGISVNKTFCDMLGYTEEELRNKTWQELTPPEEVGTIQEMLDPLLKGEKDSIRFSKRYIHKNGTCIWADASVAIRRDNDGKPLHFITTVVDITDRKRAEAALVDSEKKFRILYEEAPAAYQSLDEEGHLLEINSAWLRLLGYSRDEAIGKSFADFLSPSSQERFLETFAQFKIAGEVYGVQHEMVSRDGSTIQVSIDGRISRTEDGMFAQTHCVFQDITEKKAAEKALRESEERYRAVVDNLQIGISVINRDMEIVAVNPFFQQHYPHVRPRDGQLCYEAYNDPPSHSPCSYCPCVQTFQDGMVHESVTETPAGGRIRDYRLVSCPVKDEQGNVELVIELVEDITERRALQAQLAQAQKMEAVGTLAGGIAHDFNNILQVALGYSELLLTGKTGKDPDHDDLQKIQHAARSGADLVRNLLTFSRKAEPKPVPMDLNNQVRNVEKLLHRTIPRMIDIQMELADDLKRINADPGQIEQIIMNLAVNARDAMGDEGSLTLRTENVTLDEEYCRLNIEAKPGGYALLSVSDTGHGMDKETLQHIFEPFYTTKELGRGTGLGLAMVYGIVKQHGGHIDCYSEPGHGTAFKLYFPAISLMEEPAADETGVMPAFGTETVLLVDDEDLVRELGERILMRNGYTVLAAANGEEALEVYDREQDSIALIILDLIMPTMGGKDCLKKLLDMNPRARVLIASGYSADASTKECVELGAKGFVAKPFRFKELLQQVRKALDES